jgi:hypothetical protein
MSVQRVALTSRWVAALTLPVGIGAVALLASPLAWYAFFTGFQEYDDEGYLLISLRDYARGGVLYDEVYSQYGPAYFQLLTPIFRVTRLAFTHAHGRGLALALVVATAILCAVVTWRLTRNLAITLASEVLVLLALLQSRDEPLHPGALLALLLGGLLVVGTFLRGPRWRLAASLGGALLAVMLLIKINVGGLAVVGLAGALAAASAPSRLASASRVAIGAGMAAVPIVLLGPSLGEATARAYLTVALAAALGVVVVAFSAPPGRAPMARRMWTLALAGGAVLAGCLGWELGRGTTLPGLLGGMVLVPLRHPGDFFVGPELGPEVFLSAAVGLCGALAFVWARRRGLTERPSGSVVLGLAELLAGSLCWLGFLQHLPMPLLALTPFQWIALASRRAHDGALGPLVLAMVAALQTLHAYPVAGTQVAWATFLLIPVGAVALEDGWRRTREALDAARVFEGAATRLVGASLAVALTAVTASAAYATHRRLEGAYGEAVPLDLPGTQRIRVPAEQAALYRFLVQNLTTRCRTFVTQPGLYSLYFFTGMESPTRLNATIWMLLLSDAQQQRVVDRLTAAPPPVCALRRERRVFRTPLARYIEERFVTLFEVEFFSFRIRREPGRPAPA